MAEVGNREKGKKAEESNLIQRKHNNIMKAMTSRRFPTCCYLRQLRIYIVYILCTYLYTLFSSPTASLNGFVTSFINNIHFSPDASLTAHIHRQVQLHVHP